MAQNRRKLWSCSTVLAPCARAASRARQPNSGWMLCTCTTSARCARTAFATSSGRSPPLTSARAARTRPASEEERSPFAARRLYGPRDAFRAGSELDVVIAPFAGGGILPAAYAGARAHRRRFVLWASVWVQPRSAAHALALPVTNHIYRRADAVI